MGPRASGIAPEPITLAGTSEPEHRLARLLERARVNPARPILIGRGDVEVSGSGRAVDALAAWLALEPGVRVHRASASHPSSFSGPVLRVPSALRIEVVTPDGAVLVGRPELPSARERAALAARARDGAVSLPALVAWRELPSETAARGVPIGLCAGPEGLETVTVDPEGDGPHLLIGGTTGSGKSEFLRTLALGWAADRSPAQLQLLFVDFKGGATFTDLLRLPHAVGLVTDLDPLAAERTLLGLRAELRRRERLLVEHGLRDASQAPDLVPRLAVLVDEFAALIDTVPELHAAFADLSARGRSLGVHLVLGTQHPAVAVRDAVAANCAVRVAFRLPETAGAAFVGALGRALATAPAGRAVVVGPSGDTTVQVAAIDGDDIAAVAARWAGAPGHPEPWLPPLPALVRADDLASARDAGARARTVADGPQTVAPPAGDLAFGLGDDPGELRRFVATWSPLEDGPLGVIGCPGSGRSSTLAALAEAARAEGRTVIALPVTLPGAWERLERIAAAAEASPPETPPGTLPVTPPGPILLADDLDVLVAAAAERGPELLALWDSAVRALRGRGGGAAATVGPATASRSLLGARFAARLLLRALDAEDHALSGAPRGLFDRSAPPGRGWWCDRQVQVVAPRAALVSEPGAAEPWSAPDDRDTVVIAAAPERALDTLRRAFPAHAVLMAATGAVPEVPDGAPGRLLVGDPETWQAAWATLTQLRRRSPVLAVGVTPGELRALLGVRASPPPIESERGECWLIEPGGAPPRRAGLPSPADPHRAGG
nr:FtsK/SpoIIIE domain-containing protein [Microcella frigidaquae]